jgi:hypothetical protein
MGVLGREADPESPGSYRDAAGWAMRPLPREPMKVTRFAPERALARDASHARVFARLMFVLFLGTVLAETHYHALVFRGHDATATIVNKHITSHDEDGDSYGLDVSITDGSRTFLDDWAVTYATFEQAKLNTSQPAIASFDVIRTSLPGTAARALGAPSVAAFLLWLVLGITGFFTGRKRQWYEGRKVNDSEGGRL